MTTSAPISLQDLPNEILDGILKHLALNTHPVLAYVLHEIPTVLTGTGLETKDRLEAFWSRRKGVISTLLNICRVSRLMRISATHVLYGNVAIGNMESLLLFLRTLVKHGTLRAHVKYLTFVDGMAQCHKNARVIDHPSRWKEIRHGHQGTDLDSRIFKLFGGIPKVSWNPQYEPWSKWCPYSKGNRADPEFPSEHAVVGVLLCLLNNLEHLSFVSTWFRSHSGDDEEFQRNLLDAMADPILSRQGVLSKLHTLELNPTVDDSSCSNLGAALLRIVSSLRTVNMDRSLHPRPASMDGAKPLRLPITRLSVIRPKSRANKGKDLYHLCRSCPSLESISFHLTTQDGLWIEKALTSCAGTLREVHAMSENWLPGRDMEPAVPLTCLSQLKRLETLYVDLSTLFAQLPGTGRVVDRPKRIESLLPCASLRKLHVFNDYALKREYHGDDFDDAADAVLEYALLRPLLSACDRARFPHLRLVSVRTPTRDGGVFARKMVRAFAGTNMGIGFVMFSGRRSWSSPLSSSPSDADVASAGEHATLQTGEEYEEGLATVTEKMGSLAMRDNQVTANRDEFVVKSDGVHEQDYLSDIQGPLL
ncbi:uncharacterized protein PG986_014244 [Apiospora aurea]|uniref:F-box domain-containing protein n=1 Tax=Apiospora aurea TaxID=335848 RepID=A0ABR1PSG0_9PEZI